MIKKVIAGLVLAGVGVAAYFYFREKPTESPSDDSNKDVGLPWYKSDSKRMKFDTLKVFGDKNIRSKVGFLLRNTPKSDDIKVGDTVFIQPAKRTKKRLISGMRQVVEIEKVAGDPNRIQAIWVGVRPDEFFDVEYSDNNWLYNRKDYDYAHVYVKKKQLGII